MTYINDKLPASYQKYYLQGRVGKIAGPEPAPKLSLDDVKDLLKTNLKFPFSRHLTGKLAGRLKRKK